MARPLVLTSCSIVLSLHIECKKRFTAPRPVNRFLFEAAFLRPTGFEPARSPPEPKSGASANSATGANLCYSKLVQASLSIEKRTTPFIGMIRTRYVLRTVRRDSDMEACLDTKKISNILWALPATVPSINTKGHVYFSTAAFSHHKEHRRGSRI